MSVASNASRLKANSSRDLRLSNRTRLPRRPPARQNVHLHLAQPGVDPLRDPPESGDGFGGDVALLLRQRPRASPAVASYPRTALQAE